MTRLNQIYNITEAAHGIMGNLAEGLGEGNKWDRAEKGANQGHYMQRIVHILTCFGYIDQAQMCSAIYNFMKANHKPQWVDAVTRDMSELIVYNAQREKPTASDWTKIVWGLDDEVLKKEDLLKYRTMKVADAAEVSTPTEKLIQCGFDLTSFKTPADFIKVLNFVGIKPEAEHISNDRFIWTGAGVRLVTKNNPITGKYGLPGERDDEKGYASYMGVEGSPELVKKLVKAIKAKAEFIKDFDPRRLQYISFKSPFDKNQVDGEKQVSGESIEWGFDLTGFNSAEDWKKVLSSVGIPPVSKLDKDGFQWVGKEISITTNNDPITGKYSSPNRAPEIGYASYIGITGKKELVMQAVKYIKALGDYKDESPNARDFI